MGLRHVDETTWCVQALRALVNHRGWPPDDTAAWLPWSMDAARRRELAAARHHHAGECRYQGRDFTTAEMALLRSVIAGPSALNRRPAPTRPNGYGPHVHTSTVQPSTCPPTAGFVRFNPVENCAWNCTRPLGTFYKVLTINRLHICRYVRCERHVSPAQARMTRTVCPE